MHFSSIMVIRCGDDNYSPNCSLAKCFQDILSREMATIHFLPGGGFGASLEFLKSECRKLWQGRIEKAKVLGIKKVLLIDHMPCGAYEIEFGKITQEEEKELHLENIEAARQFFKENSGLEFIAYLQIGEDKYEKIC